MNVWIASAEGSNQRMLSKRAGGVPHWLRDGRVIVSDSETQTRTVVDIQSGAFRPLGADALRSGGIPSPDGAYLFHETANGLTVERVADGSSRPIGKGVFPQVSRDGSHLIYLKLRDGLYERSLAGTRLGIRTVACQRPGFWRGPA